MKNEIIEKNNSELVIYESKDGSIKLDVNLEDETASYTVTYKYQLFIINEQDMLNVYLF